MKSFSCRFCFGYVESEDVHLFQVCPFCGTNVRFREHDSPDQQHFPFSVKVEKQGKVQKSQQLGNEGTK